MGVRSGAFSFWEKEKEKGESGVREAQQGDEVIAQGAHPLVCCAHAGPAPLGTEAPAVGECTGTIEARRVGGISISPLRSSGLL